MTRIQELDRQYIAGTYARFPLEIVSGSGSLAYDEAGKAYIDMGSGIGVTSFGISDPVWVEAVTRQLGQVQHMSNLYYTAPGALLAEQLCLRTGMKKVFFGNSGAEANECAVKVARKYAAERKGTEYSAIVTLVNSFHGRTLTTLAATGQAHYHELFQPLTPGFVHTPANDLPALAEALRTNKVAGILFECVQGEGGVLPLTAEFVQGMAKLAREQDLLLMVDEVQTGNGRTGKLYAYQHHGIQPDVVTTAKGLGGGLPLGACLLGERVQNVLGFGDHGSTFGGNPAACAGALSILDRIDGDLLQEVQAKSDYVFSALRNAPGIEDVRGLGLMIGLKPVKPASDIVARCMAEGVLCLTAKDRVRLLPALNIPMAQLEQAISVIARVCAESVN